jgi:hypothetical protein
MAAASNPTTATRSKQKLILKQHDKQLFYSWSTAFFIASYNIYNFELICLREFCSLIEL